jgi:hypothetical protein
MPDSNTRDKIDVDKPMALVTIGPLRNIQDILAFDTVQSVRRKITNETNITNLKHIEIETSLHL